MFNAIVQMRGELRGTDPDAREVLAAASRRTDHVVARLHDASGTLVFEDVVAIPRWVRGEFHGAGPGPAGEYEIDGHVLPRPAKAFVVRVPVVTGATLSLESGTITHPARFDLDLLPRDPAVARSAPAPHPPPLAGWSNGDPANRVDIVIVGDGYTMAQQTQFDSDALNLTNDFFGITPYNEYRNYVNVSALFTASSESGADQPTYNPSCTEFARVQSCCADGGASGTTPASANTAFDATFCSFGVQRLLTVDDAKVFIAAAAEPDWDEVMVTVNSATYGGSGGPIAVVSTNGLAVDIARHEYGHSFTSLADEYETPFAGYPACSDVSGPACEPNVTDQTTRPLIKWNRWIEASQPVPSVGPPTSATDAGLWEGARYLSTGMYRQGYSCLMRVLGAPFCDVASEAYALRLYQGGWGVPGGGIELIEPGSESPAPGSVDVPHPGGTFGATVLGPQAGPDVTVEWFLDNTLVSTSSVATGATTSYALATTSGLYNLELRVTDNSPIIHPSLRLGLASSRTWNVTVHSPPLQPISGKRLLIRDNPDTTKRKLVFVSKDPNLDSTVGSGIDPATDGAVFQVYNNTGTGESVCLSLPASGWAATGGAPNVGYRYEDPDFVNAPCKVAKLKDATLLKVVCQSKILPIGYSLDEPQQIEVGVNFTSSGTTYCALFGGTIVKDSNVDQQFNARNALVPGACPTPPAPCP
jgi:hypothetical protein